MVSVSTRFHPHFFYFALRSQSIHPAPLTIFPLRPLYSSLSPAPTDVSEHNGRVLRLQVEGRAAGQLHRSVLAHPDGGGAVLHLQHAGRLRDVSD